MNLHSRRPPLLGNQKLDYDDPNQWRSNFKMMVDRFFSQYRQASSCQEQVDTLEDLARFLVKEVRVLSSPNSLSTESSEIEFLLEETARRCIIEIPIVDGGEMYKIAAAVNNVLDACGIMASLTACVSCLRELSSLRNLIAAESNDDSDTGSGQIISTIDSQSKSMQNRVLKTSLHTIRRLLCTKLVSEPAQNAQSTWWATDERDMSENAATSNGPASNDEVTSLQFQSFPSPRSANMLIDPWVGNVVVLLPQLISNACHAVQVTLPSWAVATRLYPRLIECGLTNAVFTATININHSKNYEDDDNDLMATSETIPSTSVSHLEYVAALIRNLVRRRNCDPVAAGIYGYFRSKSPYIYDEQNVENRFDSEPFRDDERSKKSPVSGFLRNTMTSVSPREAAALVRSLVQYSLQQTRGPMSPSDTNIGIEDLLGALCVPLLAISWNVQESFLRQMAFESSSIQPGPASADRRLCRITIRLLHKCHQKAVSGNRNDYDHDCKDEDDISTDSSSTNSCDVDGVKAGNVLHKHVRTILASWKQPTFVQRTDRRLQRHVTTLLRSGLSILFSEAKNDSTSNHNDGPVLSPVHSLSMSILEGVTCRLESSLEDIRRDGMKVASDLAQFMGEDLVFDELGDDHSVSDDSASSRERPSTPTVQDDLLDSSAVGMHKTLEMTTAIAADKSNKKKKKKAMKPKSPRHLDPDADYLSDDSGEDEEAETDSDDDTENASSDHDESTCWEGDDDLVPFSLDDDEEDLRETPRPLSLIECLSLLRAVETEETAYSQHETGLQEVTRLVRSRPDDLPDIAVSLANQLLRLENKFSIENFARMRQDGLRSLLVQEPLSVGNKLIIELFGDGGLSDRLNVLSALNEAASELCGNITYADAHKLEGR